MEPLSSVNVNGSVSPSVPSRTFWGTLVLYILGQSGLFGILAATGCVAEGEAQCGGPHFDEPPVRYPTSVGPDRFYDYTDPNRDAVTWTINSIHNCNETTDLSSITISGLNNPDGTAISPIEVALQDGAHTDINGLHAEIHYSSTGMQLVVSYRYDQYYEDESQMLPNFEVAITAANGLSRSIMLYQPEAAQSTTPPQNDCEQYPSPVIDATNITMDPNPFEQVVAMGENIRVSVPADTVRDCSFQTGLDWETYSPGNSPLAIFFRIDNVDRSAHFEPETGEYVFDAHINTAGNQRVLMVVRDTAHSAGHYVTLDSGQFYISLGEAIDSVPPSASIASNLGDSYKVNAQVDRIVCRTNNPTATITWTITRPGLLDPADPTSYLQTFEGAIIPSYTFDVRGTYEFQCLVTTADRLLTNYDTRRVGVYPAETELPSGSIVAPTWARAGQSIDFVSPSADESLYSYTWIFHDGTEAATGPAVSHSFESPGTYAITLRITSLANPELQREYEHTITIIEADVDISTPSLSVVAPPAVHEGVEFPLTVGSIDTTHFTYQWELGDNPSLVNGASISYHYDAPGNYGVRIVATSMTNSEYVFYSPYYYIYVIAADSPLPELSIEAPLSAQVEHEVMFQLAADLNLADFGYTFDFGDGETEVVTDNSVPHIYHRTGIFQTILTAVSLGDGSVYRQTFNITIF